MCTLSLVPVSGLGKNFILTSNRDEVVGRETLPPNFEEHRDVKILCPRDARAGGTWVGVSEFQRLVCLLNGAFEKHQRKTNYRKSRGVVVKDILVAKNALKAIAEYDFTGIEPFTLILVEWKEKLSFYELVWDGQENFFRELVLKEHIWSSAPLFKPEIKKMRRKWFEKLKAEKGLNAESLLDFHYSGGIGDKNIDLIVDRGFLRTQSITQVQKTPGAINFWYEDLTDNKVTEKKWKL